MSVALAKREAEALAALVPEIQAEHEASEHHAQFAVKHAIRCGELLTEAKSKVRHGEWYPWLEENFPSTPQTASTYIRLAANQAQIESAPSIRSALAGLAEPRIAESPPEDDEPEVLDGEVVAGEKATRRSRPDGPVHHFPDVVADDAEQNLRTQALHWFEQGAHIKELLDTKRPLEPRSAEDREAIKREATAMERVARRLKEAASA